jgi:hypothetical protein
MARARLLKPGFFTNETLAELSPLHRLCYEGLWTLADREGRLEDRPKRIKLQVLPFDDVDIDQILSDLEQQGFVQRYVQEGERYIAIPTFLKHQNPHVNEPKSVIPPPSKKHSSSTRRKQDENHASTRAAPEDSSSSTRAAPEDSSSSTRAAPEDSGGVLIRSLDPESESRSGVLIRSRSLDPESGGANRARDPESESGSPSAPLRGASPHKGETPLRGSRKTKRNLDAMQRAVAHIQSRGKR